MIEECNLLLSEKTRKAPAKDGLCMCVVYEEVAVERRSKLCCSHVSFSTGTVP